MSKKKPVIRPQTVNANQHTPRGMGELERSIGERGWIGAMTVAEDGESFDGSARLETGAAKGWDFGAGDIPIIKAEPGKPLIIDTDGSTPIIHRRYDIPTADDPRAKLLAIEANKIAADNLNWSAEIIAGLAEEVDLFLLFPPMELAPLLEEAGTEVIRAADLWKGMPEFEQEDQESWKAIKVHFENEQDYQAFARLVNQTLTPQTKYIWYPYKEKVNHLDYRAENES